MKAKIILPSLALMLLSNLVLPTYSFAQVTQEWVSIYNGWGNGVDVASSIAVDSTGNVYVTGGSPGNGTSIDYLTIKISSLGDTLWTARYNGFGAGVDIAYSLAVDVLGNVYVTGRSDQSLTNFDYATLKYNSAGVQQWVARYNGPGNGMDDAFSIAVDGSGSVYVTGRSLGSGTNSDFATIKYNSSGVQQWVARYNGPQNDHDEAYSLAVDSSGNVYVTGSQSEGLLSYFATIKYNSMGVEQWIKTYKGTGNNGGNAFSIKVDGLGNVYVIGRSDGGSTFYDYATIKYNTMGDTLWIARYNGPGGSNDIATSLALDGSGNVYVTGRSQGSGTNYDYATIKYSSSGIQQWVASYNGPGNGIDGPSSIAVDLFGNVFVTGISQGSGTSDDYATIKYDSTGVEKWVERYNGLGNGSDAASSLAVDGTGNVYVTGWSFGNATNDDYTTLKYSQQSFGIETIQSEFSSFFLYPNPSNNYLTITLSGNGKRVQVTISDITGKIIYSTIVTDTQKVEVNTIDFAQGVYVVQVQTADFIGTEKIVVKK